MTGSSQNRKSALLMLGIIFCFLAIAAYLQTAIYKKSKQRKISPSGDPAGTQFTGIRMEGFTITAYCPGTCCNGIWEGLTVSGKRIEFYTKRGVNIAAVDPTVISLGSYFVYGDKTYYAADIGGSIKGRRIDIFKPDHLQAQMFGVKRGQSIRLLVSKKEITQI